MGGGVKPSGYLLEFFTLLLSHVDAGWLFKVAFPSSCSSFYFVSFRQLHPERSFLLQCSITIGQTPKLMLSLNPLGLSERLWTFSSIIHPSKQRSPKDQEERIRGEVKEQEIPPQDDSQGLLLRVLTGLLFPVQTAGLHLKPLSPSRLRLFFCWA